MPMNKLAVCEVDKTRGLPLSARVREKREMEKKLKKSKASASAELQVWQTVEALHRRRCSAVTREVLWEANDFGEVQW